MIIFQFDDVYHKWGLLALQSLQLHEPRPQVLCDTINLTESQIAELHEAHARVIVSNHTTAGNETSPAQMAARKPFVMQRAMQRFSDQPWYGLLDADFLVRRPLQALWSLLDHHPAALFMTNGMWNGKYYRKLLTPSGIVLVRPEARRLIDCWAKWCCHDQPLESIEPGAWFWDQIALAEAWTEAGVRCAMIPMNVYGDCQLSFDSAIWSAHVPEKATYYELFRREYLRQCAELSGGNGSRES
jgi:hypothetical protein